MNANTSSLRFCINIWSYVIHRFAIYTVMLYQKPTAHLMLKFLHKIIRSSFPIPDVQPELSSLNFTTFLA